MGEVKRCPHCMVPKEIASGSRWENDGTISGGRSEEQLRVLFYEVQGLGELLCSLENLMGPLVNRIVMEVKKENTIIYLRNYLSGIKGALARTLLRRKIYEGIAKLGAVNGYGHVEILQSGKTEPLKIYGRNLYSVPMFMGDIAAAFTVIEGLPAEVEMEEKDGGHIFTLYPGKETSQELSRRIKPEPVPIKPGDVPYERCPKCGLPADLRDYSFDLDEGTITSTANGRRMAMLSLGHVDAVLKELQKELGEDIAAGILQAQRDYARKALSEEEAEQDQAGLNRFFALRGMGNLVDYRVLDDRMEARVDNAQPALFVAGLLQGMFELRSGGDSTSAYTLGEDGTLEVSIEAA